MKTNNPELKLFIMDLILYEDDLDEKGQRVRRSQFPKQVFKGIASLRKKLGDAMEVGVVFAIQNEDGSPMKDKDGLPVYTPVQWKKPSEVTHDMKIIAERHIEVDMDITDTEIEAIKHLYGSRWELSLVSPSTFDEFETLIGKSE